MSDHTKIKRWKIHISNRNCPFLYSAENQPDTCKLLSIDIKIECNKANCPLHIEIYKDPKVEIIRTRVIRKSIEESIKKILDDYDKQGARD